MDSLRALLVQRAARLQDRPALSAPDWGTLSWSAWRRRVEGLGFALLAQAPLPAAVHSATGTAWDWAWETAAACCGLPWDPAAAPLAPGLRAPGGPAPEAGRGPYHHREQALSAATPFAAGLDHGAVLLRLRRLNDDLGWDHRTALRLPLADLALPGTRAALWSLAFAGGHALLEAGPVPGWDPGPFAAFWEP